MRFIRLPSGIILNMAQVAYIKHEGEFFCVCFSAAVPTSHDFVPLALRLDKADENALIAWLKKHGDMDVFSG